MRRRKPNRLNRAHSFLNFIFVLSLLTLGLQHFWTAKSGLSEAEKTVAEEPSLDEMDRTASALPPPPQPKEEGASVEASPALVKESIALPDGQPPVAPGAGDTAEATSHPAEPDREQRAVPSGLPQLQPDTPAPAKAQKGPPPQSPPARDLFKLVKEAANYPPEAVGSYSRGCLAGGQPLPTDGPGWQIMRLSRNRNWGHPVLIAFLEHFAKDVTEKDGWPGLLIGDLAMPRGGPMPSDHASHQTGLDVDIWYKPMPSSKLTLAERDLLPLQSFLKDPAHVNPEVWTSGYEKVFRRVASYPEVARVFVNPVIKKWLCETAKENREFLHKIIAIPGHHDHMHVRLMCPPGSPSCQTQAVPSTDGCDKHLDAWLARLSVPVAPPKPDAPQPVIKERPPILMSQLPPACAAVLKAPPEPALASTQTAAAAHHSTITP